MRNILLGCLVASLVVGCSSKEKDKAPAPAPAPVETAGSATGSAAPAVVPPATGSADKDTGSAAPAPAAGSAAPAAAATPPSSSARPNHVMFPELEGKAPIFPQLSGDGQTAIASVVKSVGPTGKTKSSLAVILAAGKPDTIDASKKGAAEAVQKKLADGKYTPFETIVDLESANTPLKLGTLTFDVKDTDTGITLQLSDDKGGKLQELAIPIAKQCSANPRPDYVWFDSARKRVFVEVGWELGPHDCNDAPPPQFVLWPTP